jgi:hypothetical protein
VLRLVRMRSSKITFATTLVPDIWTDVHRVLKAMPPEIDLLRVHSCTELAALAGKYRAIGVLRAMRAIVDKYYLPLFFEALRAASLRPLVRERIVLPAAKEIDAGEWSRLFEVPWSKPDRSARIVENADDAPSE